MAFEYRFNVIRFYSKLNRFVLSPRKKPNHFVLKIRPGGFADYIYTIQSLKDYLQYSFLRLLVPMKYNSLVWKTVSAFIRRFKTLGFLLTKTNVEQRHAQQYLPYSRTVEPHFTCIHFMQTV